MKMDGMREEHLVNFNAYNQGMRKSMYDKLFFVDKVEVNAVFDFGCADASLIEFLSFLFPEWLYVGYDLSPEMVEQARQRVPQAIFSNKWEDILHTLQQHQRVNENNKATIVLSSIIHEVYSYCTTEDARTFWNRVFNSGFDYIVIRDMIPSKSINKKTPINDVMRVYQHANKADLYDFESVWGSIEENRNLLHFLLKYRYKDNWEREVRENYMPVFREDLLASIPDGYRIIFHDHYVHPYTERKVREDFNIQIRDNTHLKLILERVK